MYNSIFNITEENNKFELYTQPLNDEFSNTQMKGNIAEIFGLSVISLDDLQHEIRAPIFVKTYSKQSMEKGQTDGYYKILIDYVHSPFRDFESYLRVLTGLNEDNFQLILTQYNSKIVTYKISTGAYAYKDLFEVLSGGFENEFEIRIGVGPNYKFDKSDSIIINIDNVSLITKLKLGPQIHVSRFDKNSFFNSV